MEFQAVFPDVFYGMIAVSQYPYAVFRAYQDSAGIHLPCPNSLWSYYEYMRLTLEGIEGDLAFELSKPFLQSCDDLLQYNFDLKTNIEVFKR